MNEELKKKLDQDRIRIAEKLAKKKRMMEPVVRLAPSGHPYVKVNGPFDSLEGTGESLNQDLPPETEVKESQHLGSSEFVAHEILEQQKKIIENTNHPESHVVKTTNKEAEKALADIKADSPVGIKAKVDKKNLVTVALELIEKVRVEKKISQAKMAERLGITLIHYSRIERGITKLQVSMLGSICDILELNVKIEKIL